MIFTQVITTFQPQLLGFWKIASEGSNLEQKAEFFEAGLLGDNWENERCKT